jgi:hypothetical protein
VRRKLDDQAIELQDSRLYREQLTEVCLDLEPFGEHRVPFVGNRISLLPSQTKVLVRRGPNDQPTTLREYRSMTTA